MSPCCVRAAHFLFILRNGMADTRAMPFVSRFKLRRCLPGLGVFTVVLLGAAAPARAIEPQSQEPQSAQAPASTPQASTPSNPPGQDAAQSDAAPADAPNTKDQPDGDLPAADSKNRIFGVVPNYTTVEGFGTVPPITTAKSFKLAAMDSFDPFVYPLFGFVAGVAQLQNEPASW